MRQPTLSRRSFFFAAGIGAGSLLMAQKSTAQTNSTPLKIAFIGCHGLIAPVLIPLVKNMGLECPCFADVDSEKINLAKEAWPKATHYTDYRKMFDKQGKEFDAVIINTPDHHHYPATLIAMQLGKHVYTQKPLTHTIWEARQLTLASGRYKVATQMGNQGHASEGVRVVVEYLRSGMLGDVRTVHIWTNRPLWPQGGSLRPEGEQLQRAVNPGGGLTWPLAVNRPAGNDPVPSTLDWDCWIGPAPMRPYKKDVYHPVLWRAWWDFGCGAIGDMGVHMMDAIFWGMNVKAPSAVEPVTAISQPLTSETLPGAAVLKWEFAAEKTRPGFSVFWYERGLKPPIPPELEPGYILPETGTLIIGSKATMMVTGDLSESARIIPVSKNKELGKPPKVLERSPGHLEEWVAACKGDKPLDSPQSSFSYGGPLTETMLLGCVAARVQRRIEWDADAMRVTNYPDANRYLSKEYRPGWYYSI